eukprot:TRINITY_DN1797_c0_g2_i1.p1 TRINITY_DN1797_c0_g2~~TRINITY_DN1797_c0_g2_i1.p1  ORF type:complete len:756 (+),score=142.34 TRINITY_DN1797_c0_g2_i1:113-2380(+)
MKVNSMFKMAEGRLQNGYNRILRGTERLKEETEKLSEKVSDRFDSALNAPAEKIRNSKEYEIAGRIVLEERQINEGGFAFIYTARDVHTHEELVLKKICCQDSQGLAMARREVGLLERLPEHANLVRFFGSTECASGGRAREVILLFEFCTGGHLLDLLTRNNGKLTETRILEVFRDLCVAVSVLHSMEPPIQHRDLKVENVLLGSNGCFKLCDFGSWCSECSNPGSMSKPDLSKFQEHVEKYTTMMYRPPEMVDFYHCFAITTKVDIWMLGCILFTLMFYRHPFQDESPLAIANARYHLPSSPTYSDKLVDLVHWLLAQDPSDRPTALELLGVVENFTQNVPLPLPAKVVEKRDTHRRLYEGKGPSPKSSPGSNSSESRTRRPLRTHSTSRSHSHSGGCSADFSKTLLEDKKSSEGKTKHKSKHKSSGDKKSGDKAFDWPTCDFGSAAAASPWGAAPVVTNGGWPTAGAPQPSTPWAAWDSFGAATPSHGSTAPAIAFGSGASCGEPGSMTFGGSSPSAAGRSGLTPGGPPQPATVQQASWPPQQQHPQQLLPPAPLQPAQPAPWDPFGASSPPAGMFGGACSSTAPALPTVSRSDGGPPPPGPAASPWDAPASIQGAGPAQEAQPLPTLWPPSTTSAQGGTWGSAPSIPPTRPSGWDPFGSAASPAKPPPVPAAATMASPWPAAPPQVSQAQPPPSVTPWPSPSQPSQFACNGSGGCGGHRAADAFFNGTASAGHNAPAAQKDLPWPTSPFGG